MRDQLPSIKALFLSLSLGLSVSLSSSEKNSTTEISASSPKIKGESSSIDHLEPPSQKSQSWPSKEQDEQSQWAAWMLESAQVANDYLEALDRGNYAQSWSKGDELFQMTISKEEWAKVQNSVHQRLGRAKSRKLVLQRPAVDPKGLPKGPYMVIEYDAIFEKSPSSKELLTLRRASDGKWRVLTYHVN